MYNFNNISGIKIIAEAGVNHEGKIDDALKLVKMAKKSGANFIKFQNYMSEYYVSSTQLKRLKRVKKFELSNYQFDKIYSQAKKTKINFISTPLDFKSVNYLKGKVPFFKLSSGDITNFELAEYIFKQNLPVIISTGGATIKEIDEIFNLFRQKSKLNPKKHLAILHCVASYPTELKDANLKNILTLKKRYQVTIGYSDHTSGIVAPVIAASLGAKIIEKHFTLSRINKKFHDHFLSLNPSELKIMIENLRHCELALGSEKRLISKKLKNRLTYLRRSYAVNKDMKKGEIITKSDLLLLRPSIGFTFKQKEFLINKKLSKNIKKFKIIKKNFIN